jgi:hypothetical protein
MFGHRRTDRAEAEKGNARHVEGEKGGRKIIDLSPSVNAALDESVHRL